MKEKGLNLCLQRLVKRAVDSGTIETDKDGLSELADLCGSLPSNVQHAFQYLFAQLKKPHSEMRLGSFFVISYMVEKYDQFRMYVIDHLKDIVKLVVDCDAKRPLPPPKNVALRLSRFACQAISKWRQQYSEDYMELELMYKYMQNVYKIDFAAPLADPVPRVDVRKKKMQELQLKKAKEELGSIMVDIEDNLKQFWACIQLLLPSPDDFDLPLGSGIDKCNVEQVPDSSAELLREEGYHPGVSVAVVLPKRTSMAITENEDNSAVLDNLRDCYSICNKQHLPSLIGLLAKASKLGAEDAAIKSAIDLKSRLANAKTMFENINVKPLKPKDEGDDGSSSSEEDDDWIEIPSDKKVQSELVEQQLKEKIAQTESNKAEEEKDVIPTLLLSEIPSEYSTDHAFARLHSKEDNIWCNSAAAFDPDALCGKSAATAMLAEAMATRTYVYVSEEKQSSDAPVCGAPLGNGKFCPRRDKIKCPFHGLIGSSEKKTARLKLEDVPSTSSWRDPSLERDISAALGINLTAPTKRRKRKPAFTQLRPNNPKSRIAKKLAKGAERVADAMNKQDKKRHNAKFAHSFSYSLSRTL